MPGPARTAGGCTAGRPASGTRPTWRWRTGWTARDDGHGFEIEGISGEMMRVFSSRRASITADLRGRVAVLDLGAAARV